MHVCLGALDVIMQVVAEVLNVANGAVRGVWIGEVPRKKNEGDIADVFGLCQIR